MADFFSGTEPQHGQEVSDSPSASQSTPRRGHAPKPSVGNAATLFGVSGDDPFASIAAPATPTRPSLTLGSLHEEEAPAEAESTDAAASLVGGAADGAAAGSDLFGSTSSAAAGATPGNDSLLGVPASVTPASSGTSGPPSPSKLFTSSSTYDDDWFRGAGSSGAEAAGARAGAEAAPDAAQHYSYEHDVQPGYHQQGQYDEHAAGYGGEGAQGYTEQGYYDPQGYDVQQQQQQQGEQAYGYDYSHQQQLSEGQYDYSSQQYDQQHQYDQQQQHQYDNQQHPQYDQQQYQYDQAQEGAYDQGQQAYGQGYMEQHQYGQTQQPGQASYGGYEAAAAYQQPEQNADDASAYAPPQHGGYASYDSAPTKTSYDAASYVPSAASYDYGSAPTAQQQQQGQGDPSDYWPDQSQSQTANDYNAHQPSATEYGSYDTNAAADQQPYGQAYAGYNYGQGETAVAQTPAATCAPAHRVPSPYDPVPIPPAAGTAGVSVRAASPYDPVPASSDHASSVLSPTLSHHGTSLAAASTHPPPARPPRGPPRGPARRPKPASPTLAVTFEPSAAPQEEEAAAAASASMPNHVNTYGWSTKTGQPRKLEADEERPQHGDIGGDAWTGGDEEGGCGQEPSGWVDQLEGAAATPPATEDGMVPPLLTITDENTSASVVYQPEENEDLALEASGGMQQGDHPTQFEDAAQVDQAVEALQDLDLNGEEHIDEDLERSVAAERVGNNHRSLEKDEVATSATPPAEDHVVSEEPSHPQSDYAYGYETGYGAEEGQAQYADDYGSQFQPQEHDAYRAQPAQSYGLDEEQTAQDDADPYAPLTPAPAVGRGDQESYSPVASAAGAANGYGQSPWGQEDAAADEEGQNEDGFDRQQQQQQQEHATYGKPQYDPYAPSPPDAAPGYGALQQPDGFGTASRADDAYESYDTYGSGNRYGPQLGEAPSSDEQQQRDLYEDDTDVRTPSATNSRSPWPGAAESAGNFYASPYAAAPTASEGLKRAGTVTQRSFSATTGDSATTGSGGGYDSFAPSVSAPPRASFDDSLYGSVHGGTSDRLPGTPGQDANAGSSNYFDLGNQYGSPSHAVSFGGSAAAAAPSPASPYDPGNVHARSYASEASYPSSVTGSGIDMQEQMRSAKIPVVSFGFGGQMVTYFPTASAINSGDAASGSYGGFGYGGASAAPTKVTLHSLSSVIPSSSYATAFDPLQFPGPAFEGASATALSRATGGAKAKKAALIKHLDEKIEEVSAGFGYLRRRPSFAGHDDDAGAQTSKSLLECQRAEDKVALLKLLRLILVHDAQTTNNPAFDTAVRELLTGHRSEDGNGAASPFPGMSGVTPFGPATPSRGSSGETLRTYELKSGFLETLQNMLLRGERREAVALAVEQKMWAHAMTIASCVDKECWRIVVSEFIEDELGSGLGLNAGPGQQQGGGADLQTLKVAYNVFSGQDPVSVFDLFRPKKQMLLDAVQPSGAASTAISNTLPDWRGSAAIVVSNKSASDAAALTAIGDGLAVHGLIEAAHFCYALAPATSPFGGVDVAAVRMTLLGCENPKSSSSYLQDLDGIMLTEILEFAQSLAPVAKGQDPYAGIPHLQAYRLVHAYRLAELGETQRAQKYCEAIAGALKLSKNSPYLHCTLLSQLKELSDRLVGAPQVNGSGNWMTRKMQRPTLDGVWGALEGRFTKFIAGDENDPTSSPSRTKSLGSGASGLTGPVGPFSHYTAITPNAVAGGMSRQQSYADLNAPPSVPASRAGSAMDFHHNRRAASPKNRASSAMGVRQSQRDPYSAWPQPLSQTRPIDPGSAPASSSHSFEASRNGHVLQTSEYSNYGVQNTYSASSRPSEQGGWYGNDSATDSRRQSVDTQDQGSQGHFNDRSTGYPGYDAYDAEDGGDGGGEGFGSGRDDVPCYGYQPHGAQQPQFISNIEGPTLESAEDGGFVSPMDAFSGGGGRDARTPQPQPQNDYSEERHNSYEEEDEEDDLGLGNASSKKKQAPASQSDARGGATSYGPAPAAKEDDKETKKDNDVDKPELKPSASSSWLGRLWSRSPSTSVAEQAKAKKAHLGQETAFYYDKELKRWVNKKAGDTGAPASPPPPPPRAQTTSPAMGPDRGAGASSAPPMRNSPAGPLGTGGPPPPRSALSGYSGHATPPISEEAGGPSSAVRGPMRNGTGGGAMGPAPGLARARSNLADHTVPPAAQPPTRSGSATPLGGSHTPSNAMSPPPAPPPGSRAGTVKKRPIKSRYVVVD